MTMNDTELIETMRDVIPVLMEAEDHNAISSVGDKLLSRKQRILVLEETVSKSLRDVQGEVELKKNDLAEAQKGPDFEELKEIESKLAKDKESFDNAQKVVEDLKNKVESAKKEQQRHLQIQEEEKQKSKVTLPQHRKGISLYEYVTNIKWDYTTPPEHIKGIVMNKTTVHPIDFNSSENSKFYITNSIWDSIHTDWDTTEQTEEQHV